MTTVTAHSPSRRFRQDVLEGLTRRPKRLPSKYFYDRRGSKLFDRICELKEYYLTRTELSIMEAHAADMGRRLGPRCLVIEPGAGSGLKIRMLLDHMEDPAGYVPVDISREYITRLADELSGDFPDLAIFPVHADFTRDFHVAKVASVTRRVVYFPGSTIGNFTPEQAGRLLRRWVVLAEEGGRLLIGIDLKKETGVLEAAYNDRHGVTRDFNLNLLRRIRDELDADIRPDRFDHRAFYNEREGRVEMHLVSADRQTVRLDHTEVEFEKGETIHTESSYKYEPAEFASLAGAAGWRHLDEWTDDKHWFAVQLYGVV